MKVENLRSLIRESINDYIREIDNEGNKAALEAKMTATQAAIEKRKKITEAGRQFQKLLMKNKQ